nr:immunoglobulin heavy chain junction region [Mus musculus]MBK4196016.1 immunoglobulin heavy chain junction region [Mus musculus]
CARRGYLDALDYW